MKLKYINILIIIFFSFFIKLNAAENISFIDVDRIVFESELGKKIDDKINNDFKIENEKLASMEKELKKKENDILKQKNILSEAELNKKINDFKIEVQNFQKRRASINEKFRILRVKQTNELLKKLNKILFKFADDNSIPIILRKNDIVLGKSSLDITNKILEIFNKEVKSLK